MSSEAGEMTTHPAVVLTSRDGDVPHAPLIVVLRGMSREGSTWAFFSNYGSFTTSIFSVTCFLHVDNFFQINVYLSVVKLEVHPIVLDVMHIMFLSALFVFLFERREPHNHVNPDREGLALQSIAPDNLPGDCDNRIPWV